MRTMRYILAVGALLAAPATAQVVILQDVSAAIQVTADRTQIALPGFGASESRQSFDLAVGDRLILILGIRGPLVTQPVPAPVGRAYWQSGDTTVLRVRSTGDLTAEVEALAVGTAQLRVSITLEGVQADRGDAFAAFYSYVMSGLYSCVGLTTPAFAAADGRGIAFTAPEFADRGLEGCTRPWLYVLDPRLTLAPNGTVSVMIGLLDAVSGAPVAGQVVTVELVGGAWGDGTTTARLDVTDAQGRVYPGNWRPADADSRLRISAQGTPSVLAR